MKLNRNGWPFHARSGEPFVIGAGERVPLAPGVCPGACAIRG